MLTPGRLCSLPLQVASAAAHALCALVGPGPGEALMADSALAVFAVAGPPASAATLRRSHPGGTWEAAADLMQASPPPPPPPPRGGGPGGGGGGGGRHGLVCVGGH